MKSLFNEYGDTLLKAIISISLFSIFVFAFLNELLKTNVDVLNKELNAPYIDSQISPVTIASFSGKDILINVGEEFGYLERVEAYNSNGEDIRDYIEPINLTDGELSEVGEKDIYYVLNYNGETKAIKAKLIVVDESEDVISE